jgi:predicted AAA+ superfamily ATPase
LLGVSAGALLTTAHPDGEPVPRDGTLLGALFESLVTLSVHVYADAADARVSHLRTRRGDHEVDLIVTREDGRMLALEVKLAPVASDEDVTHLRWLRRHVGPDLLDAAVITTGPVAYRRPDGIAVIPAALLGP